MIVEIVLIVVTIYALWQLIRRPSNYPPGIWGLPLIGHIPSSVRRIEQIVAQLKEKHSPIASWRVGKRLLVIIFDFKLVKDAFLSFQYVDRAESNVGTFFKEKKPLGIVSTSGLHWVTIRRFSLRHLRDLGMGKSRLSVAVQHEATELVNDFKKVVGRVTTVPKSLHVAILNVIWQMVASIRYPLDDKEILEFEHFMSNALGNASETLLMDFFPWISYIIPQFVLDKFIDKEAFKKHSESLAKFLKKPIDEHINTLDEDNPRDYIDAYLIEMKKQVYNSESSMSIEDLIHCLADFFTAGSETSTTFLQWSMLYIASFPEIQKRLQKEVDEVLPLGTLASIEDKPRLPYTEAFIHEVLRHATLAPLGFMHTAPTDTILAGYTIPKGAFILPSIYSIHRNPKYFPSPDEFRPERFLDSNGKFVGAKEGFLPFGIGRRQCLGESLARMEILIFLTAFVQSLHFDLPPGKKYDVNDSNHSPLLRMPCKFELLITNRN